MDFDSNRKLVCTCENGFWFESKIGSDWVQLVPIGSYRFLLMVRTVRTEVMSCLPVEKVYKTFQKRLPRIRSSIKTPSRFTGPITSFSFCAYRPRTPHVLCMYPTYVSARTPHVSANPRDMPYRCAWELLSPSFIVIDARLSSLASLFVRFFCPRENFFNIL